MTARSALLAAFLVASLGAGCLDDNDSLGGSSLGDIPEGRAPTGEGAGTPADHGNHQRAESDVTITRQGDQYVATRTITLTNDFGGAANAVLKLTTKVGGVTAKAWDSGGYEIKATLQGRGDTEQEARTRLSTLNVIHSDRLGAGTLTLDAQVKFPTTTQGLSGSLVARVPESPAYRITGTTNTGGASVAGLGGPSVTLEADTGGVEVSGAFNTANLNTDTGGVALDGVFNVVQATTSTGGVSARITPSANEATIDLEADTGGVDLALGMGDGQGYDIDAAVDTGGISISVGATDPVGAQTSRHKHVRTSGYEDASIKVTVMLKTDTGGVDVTAF